MKKLLFLGCLALAACQNEPPLVLPPVTDCSACQKIDNALGEYLGFDSLLVNGVFPARTDKATLLKHLGAPDRTFSVRPGSQLEPLLTTETVYWYGASSFRVLNDDRVIPYVIDLTDGRIRLQFRGVWLDHTTTPRVIETFFPRCGRLGNGTGSSWCGYIPVHTNRISGEDCLWLFVFEAAQLARVKLVSTL